VTSTAEKESAPFLKEVTVRTAEKEEGGSSSS